MKQEPGTPVPQAAPQAQPAAQAPAPAGGGPLLPVDPRNIFGVEEKAQESEDSDSEQDTVTVQVLVMEFLYF